MKRPEKIRREQDSGAAMIVAVAAGAVVEIFALSLLLASYSLFAFTVRQSVRFQCAELAKSMDRELRKELTEPDFGSLADQIQAGEKDDCRLWFYLREHLMREEDWPEYRDGEPGHEKEDAFRYFVARASGEELPGPDLLVAFYWEYTGDASQEQPVVLHVIITAEKDGATYSIESMYDLNISACDEDPSESLADGQYDGEEQDDFEWNWTVH
jgi:hypothetical protein